MKPMKDRRVQLAGIILAVVLVGLGYAAGHGTVPRPDNPGTPEAPEDLGYGTGMPTEPPASPQRERASDSRAYRKALDTLIRNETLTPLN